MSFNDRCGEALAIIQHGGVLPDAELREALIEWLESGKSGETFPPPDFVMAVLHDPANAELRAQTWDGEWHGPADTSQGAEVAR